MASNERVKAFFTTPQIAGILELAGQRFSSQLGETWQAQTMRVSEELVGGRVSIWNGRDEFILDCDKARCELSKLSIRTDRNGSGASFLWGCSSHTPSISYDSKYMGDMATTDATSELYEGVGSAKEVCYRWNSDRADMSEGTWSGDVSKCDEGALSADGRANALKLTNLYRWIAGVPPVVTNSKYDQLSQKCALMMNANKQLSHYPTPDWLCYTEEGALGASQSNIAYSPAVAGIDLYMVDSGNETTLGHRRWLLSESIYKIGIGGTDEASCMLVVGPLSSGVPPWTAWPSPGVFPIEAMDPFAAKSPNGSWEGETIDTTGWTIQSNSIFVHNAKVTVTDAGVERPVEVSPIAESYGSKYAIKFIPKGWKSEAGHTYRVEVGGISHPFSYDVQMVDCAH